MLPHLNAVLEALYYGQRHRLKKLLRIPDRARSPVLDANFEGAFKRYLRICTLLKKSVEGNFFSEQGSACEIGSGDCLATADLLLKEGFRKVYLVEKQAIVVDERQRTILEKISSTMQIEGNLEAIVKKADWVINDKKVEQISEYFEFVEFPERVDFIFSHDVVEHVEDLAGFFIKCAKVMKPGGVMVHKFDLSGHEFFEDPMPPLDFQIYPDWLYWLMFPKYRRSCRHFLDEILRHIELAGFKDIKIEVLRAAENQYANAIKPSLRKKARLRSIEQLVPLDVVVVASLPAVSN